MIGETNINGGAGLNGKGALLKIKAPTGSIITVLKGSYSKTIRVSQLDQDDNNWSYWIFQTTNFGEWTVTATDGTHTASTTVVISTEGQSESVKLSYRVPPGYKEIEYIESPSTGTGSGDSVAGAAFIDTGLRWNYTTIKIDLSVMFLSTTYSGIIASQDNPITMIHRSTNNNLRLQWEGLTDGSNYGGYLTNVIYNLVLEVSDSGSSFSVDGNTLVSTTTHRAVSKNGVFPLFAEYWSTWQSVYRYATQGRIYSAKIWINNVLVRDFVPCYRKSDSVVGLWDSVSEAFFTSAGTGTFIAGPDM